VEDHDEPRGLRPVHRRELVLEPHVLRRVFPCNINIARPSPSTWIISGPWPIDNID
jgi:hypothetical protein